MTTAQTPQDANEATIGAVASTAGLGAVLTYATAGRSGVHGMTIGADGAGEWAVLFMGNPGDAEMAALEYLRRLERAGWRIKSAAIVPNERQFSGESVRIVNAPPPSMAAPNLPPRPSNSTPRHTHGHIM